MAYRSKVKNPARDKKYFSRSASRSMRKNRMPDQPMRGGYRL